MHLVNKHKFHSSRPFHHLQLDPFILCSWEADQTPCPSISKAKASPLKKTMPPRSSCLRTAVEVAKALAACLVGLFKCAWQCVEFWTPLTVIFLLLWLLYRPDQFHPRVDSAVLAALDLEPPPPNATAQLRYDLAVDLSFRNSHGRLTIRYLDVGATAFYNTTKLGPADDALPAPFHQGPKNTTVSESLLLACSFF